METFLFKRKEEKMCLMCVPTRMCAIIIHLHTCHPPTHPHPHPDEGASGALQAYMMSLLFTSTTTQPQSTAVRMFVQDILGVPLGPTSGGVVVNRTVKQWLHHPGGMSGVCVCMHSVLLTYCYCMCFTVVSYQHTHILHTQHTQQQQTQQHQHSTRFL